MSQTSVIEASRNFVCIRLATYESKLETEILKSVYLGRSGELQNTTFGILSPDGRRKLVRSGRSPGFAFNDAQQMAAAMNRIAGEYAAQDSDKANDLPKMADVRLALNVAACDSQPLVVARATNREELRKVEQRLAALAWGDKFIGQFIYASTANSEDLASINGVDESSNILVVEPDQFGQKGKVLIQLGAEASDAKLAEGLSQAIAQYQDRSPESTRYHVQQGRRIGVNWDTLLPITDTSGPRRRRR